jgi:hypothetical protein
MLLPALQARRLSTRLSFSKSVPCNIIVLATGGSPAAYYLKPKVFSREPSTRVTGPSEKNVLAYNFVGLARFPFLAASGKGALATKRRKRVQRVRRAFDAPISLWLKYIHRQPTTDPP